MARVIPARGIQIIMGKRLKYTFIAASLLMLAGCAETAAMLDATANQMCQQNPTPDCYDNGRL
jgi:uncharacterized lipoprotein YajG